MLIVEQNARLALEFAATAYILDRGRIVLSGPAAEVAASDAMKESYLGAKRESSLASSVASVGSAAASAPVAEAQS